MSQRKGLFTFIRILAAVMILAGLGYWLWLRARPVVIVAPAVRAVAANAVPGSVTVRAERVIVVRSAVGGLVEKGDLKIGQRVGKGDFLIKLDTRDLELDIEANENALRTAKERRAVGSLIELELENARVDLANAERASKDGTISRQALDRAGGNVRGIERRLAIEKVETESAIAALENTLELRKLRLERMTVKSPADGQVSEVTAFPGDIISGESVVATLISNARTVEARISEENFSGIREGDKATIRFLGYGQKLFGGHVVKVLPTADPATQRYVVHLAVDIDQEKLVPGLTGDVSIVIDSHADALVIPRRALFDGKVFIVEGGTVGLRPVQTGFTDLNQVEITEGLKAGDLVLVEQLDTVRAGDKVRVQVEPVQTQQR
ncbi:MAG: efflux RND transporter periplasmic adaptor subunit [Opitutaceae bacterium]|nr:efflux RND transporter periplasmic adaptor subunit [Opitutaceae bacterium]